MRYEMEILEKMMYYDTDGVISSYPLYIYRLKTEVDREALRRAIDTAIRCYPLFGCRLREDENGPYLETNPEKPVLFDFLPDRELYYGGEISHYYPWVIGIRGREIIYTGFHGIADGMGATAFMRTVFYYYFKECGNPCAPGQAMTIEQLTPEISAKTTERSVAENGKEDAPSHVSEPKISETVIPDEMYETNPENKRIYKISIDLNQVRREAVQSEVSQFAVITPLLGEAFANALPGNENIIRITVIADKRTNLHSLTTHNCVQSIPIFYDQKKFSGRSDDLLRTVFRAILDLNFNDEEIRHNCWKMFQLEQQIGKNRQALEQTAAAITARSGLNKPVAALTYTHLTHLGFSDEMLERFEDIYINSSGETIPNKAAMPVCNPVTAGSRINFTIGEQLKDHPVMTQFLEKLKQKGIDYELEELEKYRGIHWKKD